MCFEGKWLQNRLLPDKNESRSLLAVDIQGHQRGGFCILSETCLSHVFSLILVNQFVIFTTIKLGQMFQKSRLAIQNANMCYSLHLGPAYTLIFSNENVIIFFTFASRLHGTGKVLSETARNSKCLPKWIAKNMLEQLLP